MKRSEIINILEDIFQDSWSWKSGDRHLALHVLKRLELEGMLPPDVMPPALSLNERATKDAIWVKTRWRWEDE